MGIITLYTDPKKKILQILEIALLSIIFVLLIVKVISAYQDYQNYNTAIAHQNLGHEYLHSEKLEKAIEEYEKAIVAYPAMYQSHEELAAIYHVSGQHQKTLQVYERAVSRIPDNAKLRLSYSEVLFLDGQYAKALSQAELANRITPGVLLVEKMIARCKKFIANPEMAKRDQELRRKRDGGFFKDGAESSICNWLKHEEGQNAEGRAHSLAGREIERHEEETQKEEAKKKEALTH